MGTEPGKKADGETEPKVGTGEEGETGGTKEGEETNGNGNGNGCFGDDRLFFSINL